MEDDEIKKENEECERLIALSEAAVKCRTQYLENEEKIASRALRLDDRSPIIYNFVDCVRRVFASHDYSADFDRYIRKIDQEI